MVSGWGMEGARMVVGFGTLGLQLGFGSFSLGRQGSYPSTEVPPKDTALRRKPT